MIWQPSAKDRENNPNLPEIAEIEVAIHEVELEDGSFLYLVTTLEIDAISATELYSRRYDVEFDIRDLKVTMDAENIRAHSVAMVIKELLTSVVAFNLISQFRRQAAKLARVEPRRLSFKGVWLSFRDHLLLKTRPGYIPVAPTGLFPVTAAGSVAAARAVAAPLRPRPPVPPHSPEFRRSRLRLEWCHPQTAWGGSQDWRKPRGDLACCGSTGLASAGPPYFRSIPYSSILR